MTYEKVKKIFEKNKKNKSNTYLVPIKSFEFWMSGELTFVKKADEKGCTIFRSSDGKMYDLLPSQIQMFKCVGNCEC
tara:strand:+ start:113 stop:343 length:231 start_codon:yes stop_codon:yes gene_type:complete